MAADFQPVGIFAQMIGVVDGPTGEPEDLLFQFAQGFDIAGHVRQYTPTKLERSKIRSSPRKREMPFKNWIPAFAGMNG